MRLTNSGEKARLTAAMVYFPGVPLEASGGIRRKSEGGLNPHHSVRAEVAGEEHERSLEFTTLLSPRRSVALSSTPNSRRFKAGAAFSISSNSTIERLLRSLVTAASFGCVRMGCVSRCPR